MEQFEAHAEHWLPNVTVEKTESVGDVSTKITIDISGYLADDATKIMCEFLKSIEVEEEE